MNGDAALVVWIFLCFVLFIGEPDLHDTLLSRINCKEQNK